MTLMSFFRKVLGFEIDAKDEDSLSAELFLQKMEGVQQQIAKKDESFLSTELFLQKMEGVQQQIVNLETNISHLKDSVNKMGRKHLQSHTLAEMERKEIKQLSLLANEPQKETLLELLTILDGLEEAIRSSQNLPSENWAAGLRITCDKMIQALHKWEVSPIDSTGKTFDANYHKAVDVIYTSKIPENTIAYEQRRGYLWRREVLRYTEVIVAKRKNNDNENHFGN